MPNTLAIDFTPLTPIAAILDSVGRIMVPLFAYAEKNREGMSQANKDRTDNVVLNHSERFDRICASVETAILRLVPPADGPIKSPKP